MNFLISHKYIYSNTIINQLKLISQHYGANHQHNTGLLGYRSMVTRIKIEMLC